MPNRNGVNQFDHFEHEAVHGAKKRALELQKTAPMSGAPIATHATEAPRRAQQAATRKPKQTTPAQQQPTPTPPQGGVLPTPGGGAGTYGQQQASLWAEIAAAIPDPAVQRLAERAQQQQGYTGG